MSSTTTEVTNVTSVKPEWVIRVSFEIRPYQIATFFVVTLILPFLPLILICRHQASSEQTSFATEFSNFTGGTHELLMTLFVQIDLLMITCVTLIAAIGILSKRRLYLAIAAICFIYAVVGYFVMLVRFEGGLPRLFFVAPWYECVRAFVEA
jgi:hypothetical protein